ncbi:MAG: hypothetical protein ACUVX8_00675 [Candidatus Zipacnadales bacterium]
MLTVLGGAIILCGSIAVEAQAGATNIAFETDYLKLVIGADARGVQFIDKVTGQDYARHDSETAFASVSIAGQEHPATRVALTFDDKLTLYFGETGTSALLGVRAHPTHILLQVLKVVGEGIEKLTFCDVHLALKPSLDEPFVGCALALNLRTNVPELPGPNTRLRASCVPRFGMEGAQAALIGCPPKKLRATLQQVVSQAPELPKSPVGGPWALEGPLNRTSYLFNFGGMSEATVDQWIERARSIGFQQIQIHGGSGTFRFGDCQLNSETYPQGVASMKAVVDKLHAAGIVVGMQPYAFFIDKRCPWVTPKPDPRLAKDATFTLSQDLTAAATTVPVVESTANMSTITGFFVRNSVTLMVDDELITYSGIAKEPPYAFTGCTRGAYGTQAAPHAAGAQVHHLKECFGLFVPDPETTLFEEVAAKTAELVNECGFDCIYFDALDGEDVLGGAENSWHYGSRYVFEVWKRLQRPVVIEYSTFHHHLWYLRSRMGAWDHPTRGHKRFIDLHVAANEANERMFLPSNLGWWAFMGWGGLQTEPTFSDDIEYLCTKAIATDSGLSITTYDPTAPGHQRLAEIMRRYEAVRHAGKVPAAVKAQLRQPGRDFALVEGSEARPRFREMQYHKHHVEGLDSWSDVWNVSNQFTSQPLVVRIEALASCAPYDDPDNLIVADPAQSHALPERAAAKGVTAELNASTDPVKVGNSSGMLYAQSSLAQRYGSWAKLGCTFEPVLDLSKHQAFGVWIYGDGKGEVLNFQRTSPSHITHAVDDHYVTIDFTGWRYFKLVESEGERHALYGWPYSGAYAIYRELVNLNHVHTFSVWVNNLPPNDSITCYLSPVKGIPVLETTLRNPSVSLGGVKVTFPIEMPTGSCLEFRSMTDCKLYGKQGELLTEVVPQGAQPSLLKGENMLSFSCEHDEGVDPRARVTVIATGEEVG